MHKILGKSQMRCKQITPKQELFAILRQQLFEIAAHIILGSSDEIIE